jgi:hypothetical protein
MIVQQNRPWNYWFLAQNKGKEICSRIRGFAGVVGNYSLRMVIILCLPKELDEDPGS